MPVERGHDPVARTFPGPIEHHQVGLSMPSTSSLAMEAHVTVAGQVAPVVLGIGTGAPVALDHNDLELFGPGPLGLESAASPSPRRRRTARGPRARVGGSDACGTRAPPTGLRRAADSGTPVQRAHVATKGAPDNARSRRPWAVGFLPRNERKGASATSSSASPALVLSS